ncbi:MAG: hypothetical protein HXS51_12580 [Theionarchaea archaeon]|nr:hypothetical protein [Theionarchaea archaeon]
MFRAGKKSVSALTAVLFVMIISQSTGIEREVPHMRSLSSSFLHDSRSGTEIREFCSVITASSGGTVLFMGNVDLRSGEISDRELKVEFFSAEEEYAYVKLGRQWHEKGYDTRSPWNDWVLLNEKGLAAAGSGVPLMSLTPHPERPFSGSAHQFVVKAMRECSDVAGVLELAQTFDFGEEIEGQYHIADATGDAVVISAGRDGELAFTRKDRGDGYLVSTNFNLAVPERGTYPCWRHETATTMLGEVGGENDLTVDYAASILDAIHVEGLWVNTAVSYVFDLNSGDIYLYYLHRFVDGARMSFQEEIEEISESSLYSASFFSAPLGEGLHSRSHYFFDLFSEETLEEARSEIQDYKRERYLCIVVAVIAGAMVVSGLFLVVYGKVKTRQKN